LGVNLVPLAVEGASVSGSVRFSGNLPAAWGEFLELAWSQMMGEGIGRAICAGLEKALLVFFLAGGIILGGTLIIAVVALTASAKVCRRVEVNRPRTAR
jgi:hypothetical protein